MMEIIIPFIIVVGIVLTKLSMLRSSVLVILGEMTHSLSGLINLLLKIGKTKHLFIGTGHSLCKITSMISNYSCTFVLTEGENPRVRASDYKSA
jgi:hypothetical protein